MDKPILNLQQNAATVAASGVTLVPAATGGQGTFEGGGWDPKALLVGRYLCWQFYRDQGELLRALPELREPFEDAIRAYGPWGELLAGVYRAGPDSRSRRLALGSARLRNGRGVEAAQKQGAGSVAVTRGNFLGLRINVPGTYPTPSPYKMWEGRASIDGTKHLCALEVALYHYISRRALALWMPGGQDAANTEVGAPQTPKNPM